MRTSAVNHLIAYCCLHCTSPAHVGLQSPTFTEHSVLSRASESTLPFVPRRPSRSREFIPFGSRLRLSLSWVRPSYPLFSPTTASFFISIFYSSVLLLSSFPSLTYAPPVRRKASLASLSSFFSKDIASTTADVDENHPARSLAINLSFSTPVQVAL